MKEQTFNPMLEIAEQTMKRCEEVFRTGLQLQDEARQRFFMGACTPDWQRTFSMMTGMMDSMAPRQRGDLLDLMTRNGQVFTEFFMNAAQSAQRSGMADSQYKWVEMAKRSMESVQSSVEDMTELRNKAIESWTECVNANLRVTNPRA